MINKHGCGKNIDGWHMCGVMEMGGSLVFCKDCQPAQQATKPSLEMQVKLLREALSEVMCDYQCVASYAIHDGVSSDYLTNETLYQSVMEKTK